MPNIVAIAGPNGAGKSTSAPLLIGQRLGIREFVNADVIAAGLSAFAPEKVAIEAGRAMLRRLDELAEAGVDFAFETTLASRSFAPWIARLQKERGYRFHLVFLWLPSADEAVRRVATRVQRGGHSIPPEVIQRRYLRGIANFLSLYSPIADSWAIYDNSRSARMIASRDPGREPQIQDPAIWRTIMSQVNVREQEGAYQTGGIGIMGVPFDEITRVLQEAARNAWREHKALGHPIVIWRDGKVVIVPPEEIEL